MSGIVFNPLHAPTGICGTNISRTRAIVSALPIVGVVAAFVNRPDAFPNFCCRRSPLGILKERQDELKHREDELTAKEKGLITELNRLNLEKNTACEADEDYSKYHKDTQSCFAAMIQTKKDKENLKNDKKNLINDQKNLADRMKSTAKTTYLLTATGLTSNLTTLIPIVALLAAGVFSGWLAIIFASAALCVLVGLAVSHAVTLCKVKPLIHQQQNMANQNNIKKE